MAEDTQAGMVVLSGNPVRILLAGLLCALLAVSPAMAEGTSDKDGKDAGRAAPARVLALLPADAVTEHTLDLDGERLAYTATAGTLALLDEKGEKSASVFYTAYVLKGVAVGTRPVTFAFNGGPGASSAYLHLGLVGPRVADLGADANPATARLEDNPDTWLRFTDLVLVDPVGTGWSRAANPDKSSDFWGVAADARALAKVVALYLANNGRMSSPKYLLGESYGGYRSVKVARALQEDQGILVNGIVMLSPFLEGPLQFRAKRYALGAALQLPSLAAAALDRRDRFTPEALVAAERFALTDYLTTLTGRPPEGDAARAFYARVAELTGVPADLVARSRGFIGDAFVKHDAADGRSEVASPYDASELAPDPFPESRSDDGPDPVLDGYTQALGGLFVGYARDTLGFKTDLTFNLLNRDVSRKWEWGGGGLGGASIDGDLRELLALNSGVRILVAHGRSDVVTPYSVSRYVLDHLPPIGPSGRTELKLYKGGHMFYFDPQSRAEFASDAEAFYGAPGE
jgi:carboxypeptidase C (cathepsin A)